MIVQVLARIDFLDESVATLSLSARIEQVIAPFSRGVKLLCAIQGVQQRAAEAIIAGMGADMGRLPTARHFTLGAGMCSGNGEIGR